MKLIRLVLPCLLISGAICAQEPSLGPQLKDQKAIQKDIDSISDLSPENYNNQIDNYQQLYQIKD